MCQRTQTLLVLLIMNHYSTFAKSLSANKSAACLKKRFQRCLAIVATPYAAKTFSDEPLPLQVFWMERLSNTICMYDIPRQSTLSANKGNQWKPITAVGRITRRNTAALRTTLSSKLKWQESKFRANSFSAFTWLTPATRLSISRQHLDADPKHLKMDFSSSMPAFRAKGHLCAQLF